MIRLGTRGSALALAQASWVAERLPGEVEIVPITTSGDQRRAAARVDDKSRFVKEIEEALLRGEIDLAVHSAKDVPARAARTACSIVGVPRARRPPRRALRRGGRSTSCRTGAVVGTRASAAAHCCSRARPDLDVRDLRGNVDTRLRRLADGEFDAIVLAQAGLDRLGRGDGGRPLDCPSSCRPRARAASRSRRAPDDATAVGALAAPHATPTPTRA